MGLVVVMDKFYLIYRKRHLSEESRLARDEFYNYLNHNLPPPIAYEILRNTRHAVAKIAEVNFNYLLF